MADTVNAAIANTQNNAGNNIVVGVRTIRAEADALNIMADELMAVTGPAFDAAVDQLYHTKGRVIITGMGKSGHIATKLAATFASTGTPAQFVHPAEASHGDLGMITPQDTVIAISNSGESPELASILQHCVRFSIPLIGMTSKPASTLARNSSIVLQLPLVPEACPIGKAPMTSTTLCIALGDALAAALMEKKGITADDFKIYHPGGKLGNDMLKVDELMHKAGELPHVTSDTAVPTAVKKMQQGCVIVVAAISGEMVGFVTASDLVKASMKEVPMTPETPISQVMNPGYKAIQSGMLATDALAKMNAEELTQLPVLDESKRPVGILHLRDVTIGLA